MFGEGDINQPGWKSLWYYVPLILTSVISLSAVHMATPKESRLALTLMSMILGSLGFTLPVGQTKHTLIHSLIWLVF